MNYKTMFLPIKSTSLAHYYSRACIVPSKYLLNKPNDIQTLYPNSLFISTKKWFKNSDCCIELLLTENEFQELLEVDKDSYVFNKPIPITRAVKVIFRNEEQRKLTEWNINAGAAFIPKDAFITTDNHIQEEYDVPIAQIQESSFNWTQLIDQYDKLLGGLALMKIGGEDYMNYSSNYFQTLSFFNRLIKEELMKQNIDTESKYIGAFTGEGSWNKLTQVDVKKLSVNDVEVTARAENIDLQKKFGIINFDSVKNNTTLYTLSVLATYGEGKNKKIDDLFTDIYSGKLDRKRIEGILLIFGLHNGYSLLRNKYKIGEEEKSIKFELNSKLDYYTIESIYQYVFNKVQNNSVFQYIEEFYKPCYEKLEPGNIKILDKLVVTERKAKVISKEYLEDIFPNVSYSDITIKITNILRNWIPPFAKYYDNDAIKYFEKELSNPIKAYFNKIIDKIYLIISDDFAKKFNELESKASKLSELRGKLNEKEERILALNDEISVLEDKIASIEKELEIIKSKYSSKKQNRSVSNKSKSKKNKENEDKKDDINSSELFEGKQ